MKTVVRYIIFITRQSRYTPPRIGGFIYNVEHSKFLFKGRELSLNEFNLACEQLFEKRQGVPSWANLSCQAIRKDVAEEPPQEQEPQRARDDSGQFVGDDPSTPEVNEAFDPPKKVAKKKTAKTRSEPDNT